MARTVTFYRHDGETFCIHNGFSFGRPLLGEGEDLFLDMDSSPRDIHRSLAPFINSQETIYCSLSFPREYLAIRPFLNSRWVLGGPAVAALIKAGERVPARLVLEPLERYLGQPTLSDRFTPYFAPLVKRMGATRLYYCCNIGWGCYWNRCSFCDYRTYHQGRQVLRPNIPAILEQLPANEEGISFVHLCLPAAPPQAFREVMATKTAKNVRPALFLRADKGIIRAARAFRGSLEGKLFVLGLEALSQTVLDRISKGIAISQILELTQLLMEAGAWVELSLMEDYPFTDEVILKESMATLARLVGLAGHFPRKKLWFFNNGPTLWPSIEALLPFTDQYRPRNDGLCTSYTAIIPPDSRVATLNRIIGQALINSGIIIEGRQTNPPL